GSRASDYAFLLLDTARALRSPRCPSPAAVAMAHRSHLEGRLLAVLDPKRRRQAVTRRKAGLALMLASALVVPLAVLHPWAEAQEKPTTKEPARQKTGKKQMALSGKVVDADGKPVGGAEVAVLTFPEDMKAFRNEMKMRFDVLGQIKADDKGRFQLQVPRRAAPKMPDMPLQTGQIMATRNGYGLGLQSVDLGRAKAETVIRLKPERALRGRVIDLQGHPVKKLEVTLLAVLERRQPRPVGVTRPARQVPGWPGSWKTDGQGRFVVRGFTAEQQLWLMINDDRFAPR